MLRVELTDTKTYLASVLGAFAVFVLLPTPAAARIAGSARSSQLLCLPGILSRACQAVQKQSPIIKLTAALRGWRNRWIAYRQNYVHGRLDAHHRLGNKNGKSE